MTVPHIYDPATATTRKATQEDIDRMQEIITALLVQPLPRDPGDVPPDKMTFDLAIYPNRMRNDGVFVAERKPVNAYPGIRGLRGELLFPSIPHTPWHIPGQLVPIFAEEIVRRWNAQNVRHRIKELVG
jgi:hypothetical protein